MQQIKKLRSKFALFAGAIVTQIFVQSFLPCRVVGISVAIDNFKPFTSVDVVTKRRAILWDARSPRMSEQVPVGKGKRQQK
jgi:hypothetical protein